jgi:hypothetical protein
MISQVFALHVTIDQIFGWFVFLVVEEESAALTHHLPKQTAKDCIYASAFKTSCGQVVATSTSRTAKLLIYLKGMEVHGESRVSPHVQIIRV